MNVSGKSYSETISYDYVLSQDNTDRGTVGLTFALK